MRRLLNILLLLAIITPAGFSQKLVNSPYARFGVGTLEPIGTFRSLAMGGTGVAMRDPQSIIYQNPASFSAVDTNSFVFDFGFDYRVLQLSDGIDSYYSEDMNFHHLAIAFPITKKLGFAAGILPYSSGYYNIEYTIENGDPGYDPVIGSLEETHKGIGGYNKFFVGLGLKPFGGLSVGGSMTFLFGEVDRINTYRFLDDNNYYNNLSTESVMVRGHSFELGAQYRADLDNDFFIIGGATWSGNTDYKAEVTKLVTRYSNYTGSVFSRDTLSYSTDEEASVTLPGTLAFGFTVGKTDKFMVTADYSMSDWRDSDFLGYETAFTSSSSINFGAEYVPDKYANYNLLNRVEYRVGGHLTESYLIINNEQLKEFGITFGAGIPLRRSKSKINLYFEYGKRGGSLENGLHSETFYNAGLSFNFHDYWFLKRKYD